MYTSILLHEAFFIIKYLNNNFKQTEINQFKIKIKQKADIKKNMDIKNILERSLSNAEIAYLEKRNGLDKKNDNA